MLMGAFLTTGHLLFNLLLPPFNNKLTFNSKALPMYTLLGIYVEKKCNFLLWPKLPVWIKLNEVISKLFLSVISLFKIKVVSLLIYIYFIFVIWSIIIKKCHLTCRFMIQTLQIKVNSFRWSSVDGLKNKILANTEISQY